MANITPLTAFLVDEGVITLPAKTIYRIPLQQFQAGISEQYISVSVQNTSYLFYFQNNVIENNLFLSVTGLNQTPIYFGSYRCAFGNYINLIDAGLPYLVYFLNTTQNDYANITFDTLNNGINMYLAVRNS